MQTSSVKCLGGRGECIVLAPSLFYWAQVTQVFYFHVCVLICALWLLFATMISFGSFFVLLGTSHPGFSISMYVCCNAPKDLMSQGETVLQGRCTVTCPKGHSIRFGGVGGDCTAGKMHSDLPKRSFNQI